MVFSAAIKQIRVLKAVAFVTYKEWAAYRSHMFVSLLIGPLQLMVFIYIWRAVYSNHSVINGITLPEMITYYGAMTIIHYLIMDFADWNLHMLIHTGRFVSYITRPMYHWYFALSQKVGHRILGFFFEFLPVYCILYFVLNLYLKPAYPLWFSLSLTLGFMMNFLINYSIGILGFWLQRADGVRNMIRIISSTFRGVYIPLVFFPDVLQSVLFFMPFQFAVYVPVRVFIGSYELGGMRYSIPEIIGIQAIAVVIMFCLTQLLWKLGIHKFTGVGT